MGLYTYRQNNSFGRFDEDMPIKMTIIADSKEEADTKAEALGVYFDGVEKGIDCDCCGDRWYRAYRDEEEEE